MQIKQGIPVSPGVAITKAFVMDSREVRVPRRLVAATSVEAELERLDQALTLAQEHIAQERDVASRTIGEDLAKIFDVHAMFCRDDHLHREYQQLIRGERVTAEYAVFSVLEREAVKFQALDNPFFRDRVADIYDIRQRLLDLLVGQARRTLDQITDTAALVATDLTPTQTATLDTTRIRALATDLGGRTSHTAIMAHALGIPAVVGLGDLSGKVQSGDTIIVDGNRGLVIIEPDAAKLLEYRLVERQLARLETSLGELAGLPAVTLDGTPVTLMANIEFPSEVPNAIAKGAVGIGLYRTEFLYLASESEPTEDQQYDAYVQTLRMLEGRPLTIRTLDLGADKMTAFDTPLNVTAERNPFLGCRSIRLCLQNLPLFRVQLRAILRASAEGPMRIMFPLISSIMELRQAKMVLQEVMEDLEEQGVAFSRTLPVGIMIEVPSAAIQAKALAQECSFFSIGTNDLIQYTVAVDRANQRIANLYSGAHPAVLWLIREVARSSQREKVELSICGEMAGEPMFIMLLLGLGLRTLSVVPPALPEVKRVVRSVTIDQCQRVARKAMSFDSDRQVINYLKHELQRILPEVADGRSVSE